MLVGCGQFIQSAADDLNAIDHDRSRFLGLGQNQIVDRRGVRHGGKEYRHGQPMPVQTAQSAAIHLGGKLATTSISSPPIAAHRRLSSRIAAYLFRRTQPMTRSSHNIRVSQREHSRIREHLPPVLGTVNSDLG
jgi:hypothetical protein